MRCIWRITWNELLIIPYRLFLPVTANSLALVPIFFATFIVDIRLFCEKGIN